MDMEHLEEIFESFCAFGSSRNLAQNTLAGSLSNLASSTSNLQGPLMDGQKFAKFARETKIINAKVTTVDVDNAFVKVKDLHGRKIDFNGFQKALRILAEKRYPNKSSEEAFLTLVNHVCQSKGPKVHSIQPEATGIFEKLTDTKLYTGAHKARFDDNGVGRGAAGQSNADDTTKNLSTIVSRDPAVQQKRGVSHSTEALDNKPATKKGGNFTRASNSRINESSSPARASPAKSAAASSQKPAVAAGSAAGGSVFDRLTDPKGYRGTHAQRFDESGKGKGLAGRDSPAKGGAPGAYRGGDVKDLSQILRS